MDKTNAAGALVNPKDITRNLIVLILRPKNNLSEYSHFQLLYLK